MNDPRFQLSKTFDHNFTDPFRLTQTNSSCSINLCNDQEFVQFRPNFQTQNAAESDDSGVCSPPLWKNSPSPPRGPSQPLLSHHVYRSLSPTARLQAIAKGQKELMEMVKNMPESSYELSLKDLVEHHRVEAQTPPFNDLNLQQKGVVKVKRQESKRSEKNMVRNGSFELESKGMFLKMVFPFSLQSKKKRNLDRNSSGRVSTAAKGGGGGEGDWWKKKFTGSSDSDSSRVSNNSGGGGSSSRSSSGGSSSGRSYGGGRKSNRLLTGCWPFFRSKTSKSVEEKKIIPFAFV